MTGKNISENDNEQAGRLLLFGAMAIFAICALMVAPILIGGFLIGLTWYGAYMEDGESNGEKLIWPIGITLAIFIWLFGMFPPFSGWFEGALFTDFSNWTGQKIGGVLATFNTILPHKFAIRSVSTLQVQIYCWAFIPMAAATLTYLHFRGAGRGVIIYQSLRRLLTPLRFVASRELWITIGGGAIAFCQWYFNWPRSILLANFMTMIAMAIYRLTAFKSGADTLANSNTCSSDFIQLGHERGKAHKKVTLSEDQLNHHVHIVGASGFGKSVLLSHIVNDRISSGRGLMLVDLKADFETIRQVVSAAKAANRLDDLAIFSCGNPEISTSYNVLANGTANQLKDRIMSAFDWSEEYYKNEAASFLLKLLRGLAARRDANGTPIDLKAVLDCIGDPKAINKIAEVVLPFQAEIRKDLEALSTYMAKPENTKALQGLRSQLEALLLSDFGHLLSASKDGIDLLSAIKNKKIVYLLLDSRTYGESSRALGKLILQDLKAASARIDNEQERHLRSPFTVVIDEFADLATEDFVGFLDRARSSKIGVVVAHQEIADLSRISPEFARRLMNSTSTLFAFLQKLPDSSELISGIAGTRKAKEVTEQAKSNWVFGDEKTGMKSIKEVDEFVLHPNLIRSLGVGECALVQKYPRNQSCIMKVNREDTVSHLSETEVRHLLGERGRSQRAKLLSNFKMETTRDPQPSAHDDRYWDKDNSL